MSHLVAFFGNDPDRVACALSPARTALHTAATGSAQGWAWASSRVATCCWRSGRAPAPPRSIFSPSPRICTPMRGSRGHRRRRSSRRRGRRPLPFSRWLFASIGDVAGFASVREKLLESVPDFLRRNLRGRSASEHLFHLFLAFLHDGGILEQPGAPPEAVHRPHASVAYLERLLGDAGFAAPPLAVVATNGRCLAAVTRSHPMLLEIAGIADCPVCRAKADRSNDRRRISDDALRALVLEATGLSESRPGWRPLRPPAAWWSAPTAFPCSSRTQPCDGKPEGGLPARPFNLTRRSVTDERCPWWQAASIAPGAPVAASPGLLGSPEDPRPEVNSLGATRGRTSPAEVGEECLDDRRNGNREQRANNAVGVLAGDQRKDDQHRVDLRRVTHDLRIQEVGLDEVNPMIHPSTSRPRSTSKRPTNRATATIGTDDRIDPKIGIRLIVAAMPAEQQRVLHLEEPEADVGETPVDDADDELSADHARQAAIDADVTMRS